MALKGQTMPNENDVQQKMFNETPKLVNFATIADEALALDDTGQIWFFCDIDEEGKQVNEFRKFPMKFNHDWVPPKE